MGPLFSRYVFNAGELEEKLLPLLRDRVFHVTPAKGCADICKQGLLKNNQAGKFGFTFGQSVKSYGRLNGCVCLFDLRDISDKKVGESLEKYYFLNPSFCNDNPFFLLVSEGLYPKLISWKKAWVEKAYEKMLIPYVECWFPGDIPIDGVAEVLEVKVQRKKSPFTKAILEANGKSG